MGKKRVKQRTQKRVKRKSHKKKKGGKVWYI